MFRLKIVRIKWSISRNVELPLPKTRKTLCCDSQADHPGSAALAPHPPRAQREGGASPARSRARPAARKCSSLCSQSGTYDPWGRGDYEPAFLTTCVECFIVCHLLIEFGAVQKCANVSAGMLQTNVYSQKSASIQSGTSPPKPGKH